MQLGTALQIAKKCCRTQEAIRNLRSTRGKNSHSEVQEIRKKYECIKIICSKSIIIEVIGMNFKTARTICLCLQSY